MRILFSTWPAHGHLLPLLPMIRAAQQAGHDVVLASGAEGVAEAARRGIPTWDVGPSRAEADADFRASGVNPAALPPEERMPAIISGMFGAAAFRRAGNLVPRAEQWRPDLVVHPITELAGAIAAARTGARHVVHGLGPLPAEAWDWFGARYPELCERWNVADHILGVPYLDNCPPSLQDDAVAAFRDRWALRPTSGEVLPGERLPWDLSTLPYETTLHLTLGTLFFGATEVFQTALAGLRDLPVNVVVALGPGSDPARLGPQPSNVLVTDFVPHALLLPHCAGLVTQGGAGTIVAALCHGLPHLILPQGADQFVNSARAAAAGVATVLPPHELSPATVAKAAGELPALRANARAVQAEISGLPEAGAVLERLGG
ncbi:glycosyltransferase [Actinoplanes aureus]|uniref:Glycosyltransferase family 1 protein n=1 Tax=Actinoplanes aureus TaxID=2792083 RepID=A0A931C8F3_9ACTN|nr:glycosyltransferase [Actinoplanes aureus]MBG0561986.1 glycosyltransferase family 1 protein [Actinoplanes aureus]